jgi:hypothetical protein
MEFVGGFAGASMAGKSRRFHAALVPTNVASMKSPVGRLARRGGHEC